MTVESCSVRPERSRDWSMVKRRGSGPVSGRKERPAAQCPQNWPQGSCHPRQDETLGPTLDPRE